MDVHLGTSAELFARYCGGDAHAALRAARGIG
jgi:hypothetical protein